MNNATGYIAYQLKGLMADRAIASLFTDPNNPDDFIAGFVQAVNNRTTLVNAITPYGMMDGYFAIRLGAILEVQYDSIYAQRLALLMRMGNQGPQPLPIREEEDALAFLLDISQRRGVAVTLWTASESYAGFVTQANDLFLGMEPVEKDVMQRKPRPKDESLFSGGYGLQILLQGLMFGALTLVAYKLGEGITGRIGSDIEGQSSVVQFLFQLWTCHIIDQSAVFQFIK